ncbi:hypothetical protein GVY41_18950 [Frigidibacter albus]|uniref:Uncharacterized protein n=1 Tax=Frigidibacter albus TaxID=1465486 RepID=A0A6L8VM44_9RHOB|nr:hypothetical protein [Frigidibacter albus]MZQ91154.1 hypothetical protein [Frigidibacter albus]NBE33080.1 hypothetical protein [Frigidibacter albus]
MSDVEASSIEAPKPHVIGIEFYSKRGNKDELLINSDELRTPFDAKARWFSYSFARPVFLTRIEIASNGYASYDKFDIEVDHVDGTRHEERISVDNGFVRLHLGKLATAFRFRPDKKYLSDPKLIRVVASGYTENEFHDFEWIVKEFHSKSAALSEREKLLELKEAQFSALKAQRTEIESAVGKTKAEYEQLVLSLAAAKDSAAKLATQEKDMRQRNSSAEETLRDLNSRIDKENTKLQELVREVRLFPSEIAGFVKEGNRSILTYMLIGAPFLIVLITIVVMIFVNAVNLTQIYKEVDQIDIWTVFLTRIPFVLVAIALIEASGYIVGRLVFEVIRINRQRVEFSKLSIIAKDVSTASAAYSEEMTEQEIYDSETKLKMDLLREHMKNYVGSEFEYKGTGLIAAIKGVAERLARKSE